MKEHCCDQIAGYIDPKCDQHPDPFDCEDALVIYEPMFDSYALLPRFGAGWVTNIRFCPWCGDKKRDLRDIYFAQIEELGIEIPAEENVPEAYRSDAWWREQGL